MVKTYFSLFHIVRILCYARDTPSKPNAHEKKRKRAAGRPAQPIF